MRLIDADKLMEDFGNTITEKSDTMDWLNMIYKQPTAYSVDKVIDELKELDDKSITRYKNGNFGDFDGVEYYIKKRDAIEIVKHGGISDDVCEWKMTDTKKLMPYETSCGNEDLYDNSYKYCPYCGKKILCKE